VNQAFDADGTSQLNGFTVIPNPTGLDVGAANPGCIVSANSVDFSSTPSTKMIQLTRTLAHELGHFMMNVNDDDGHVNKISNIMRTGARSDKRDITPEQVTMMRGYDLSSNPDF
jgi:hypothetical protein